MTIMAISKEHPVSVTKVVWNSAGKKFLENVEQEQGGAVLSWQIIQSQAPQIPQISKQATAYSQ